MPVVAELRGAPDRRLVDLDAETRPGWTLERPVGEAERVAVDEVVEQVGGLVVVDAPALLLDEEVRRRAGDVHARGERDRPERAMRRKARVEDLGEGGYAARLRDPTRVRHVGLRDRDPRLQRRQELGSREEAL